MSVIADISIVVLLRLGAGVGHGPDDAALAQQALEAKASAGAR